MATSEASHPALLCDLPEALLQQLIGSFCTGKSMSTLLEATWNCPLHGNVIRSTMRRVLRGRIDTIIKQTASLSAAPSIHRFLRAVILEEQEENASTGPHFLTYLSIRLAVVDYFESNNNKINEDSSEVVMEFPVWIGTLNVAHHSNQGDWGNPSGVQLQLSTPFWNPHLVGAFRNSNNSSCGMKMLPQMRNFRTVPPIGRMEGVRSMDVVSMDIIQGRMAEHDEVLAPHFIFATDRRVSCFLVTEDQARRHCPSYLPIKFDPYNLTPIPARVDDVNTEGKQQQKPKLYCIWMQTHDDDDDNALTTLDDAMEEMIRLMNRINLVQKSAMRPETYT